MHADAATGRKTRRERQVVWRDARVASIQRSKRCARRNEAIVTETWKSCWDAGEGALFKAH
jgi:hypothetical protein